MILEECSSMEQPLHTMSPSPNVPNWLEHFLRPAASCSCEYECECRPTYFSECRSEEHSHHNIKSRAAEPTTSKKGDRNYYCVDCLGDPLCETYRQDKSHRGHRILQVRKASHTDAIRVSDIKALLDIDHIQNYTINGALIVFLPRRPQAKPAKAVAHCRMCNRSLQGPTQGGKDVWFCSLYCKMDAIFRCVPDSGTLTREDRGGQRASYGGDELRPSSSGSSGVSNERLASRSPYALQPPKKRVRTSTFDKSIKSDPNAALPHWGRTPHSPTSVLSGASPLASVPESSSPVSAADESSSQEDSVELFSLRKRARKSQSPTRSYGVGIEDNGILRQGDYCITLY